MSGIALSVLHKNRHPSVLLDALVLDGVAVRRKGEEPQALQRREGHQAGVGLAVTLSRQHSEPVPLQHAPDRVIDVAGVLSHVIFHAVACFLSPGTAATETSKLSGAPPFGSSAAVQYIAIFFNSIS